VTRYLTTRQAREKGALVLTLKDRADRQDEWLGPYAFEYRGAIYHLMSRGDRREAIFRDGDAVYRWETVSVTQGALLTADLR